MNLSQLKKVFADNGCVRLFVKHLAPNDNWKNQVYLAKGSFDILNIFPISRIEADTSGDRKRETWKAKINFSWITENGELSPAPRSQFILYPDYPEVRFSGFIKGSKNPPTRLMTGRGAEGRILFLGVSNQGVVLGFVSAFDSPISKEFILQKELSQHGVFKVLNLPAAFNDRQKLIAELLRIHRLGWISSKRLNKSGIILPYKAPNGGGYTLEAELSITPNGYSEPDFLGWEVKQFSVKRFDLLNTSRITLMTPEPTGGYYGTNGVEAFVRKYGYKDKRGRSDRLNFGGIHKVNQPQPITSLRMELVGFDLESGKITNTNGQIAIIDRHGNEAACWPFSTLLLHWNRKHNLACYVPSISEKNPSLSYKYGQEVLLGTGTDFQFFLRELSTGRVFYDPGIKVENISTKPKVKPRSQFRINSGNLSNLYHKMEKIDVTK